MSFRQFLSYYFEIIIPHWYMLYIMVRDEGGGGGGYIPPSKGQQVKSYDKCIQNPSGTWNNTGAFFSLSNHPVFIWKLLSILFCWKSSTFQTSFISKSSYVFMWNVVSWISFKDHNFALIAIWNSKIT